MSDALFYLLYCISFILHTLYIFKSIMFFLEVPHTLYVLIKPFNLPYIKTG